MKALKALVSEKSSKMVDSEIPDLCSCAALKNNVKIIKEKKGVDEANIQMCASNC